ncbi:MAG TPA: cellulase family glycosylhydrolase [Verrucomicrobiota bacterium]|nr:cellulase family glycosylhydrolase [Verrucomicrobiota bacterium]
MRNRSSLTRRDFLQRTAVVTTALAAWPSSGFGAETTTAAGVPSRRLDKLATGTNVCLWFRGVRRVSDEHFQNYIGDDEMEFMARLGLKHVRLCVQPRVVMDQATGEILADRGAQLESAIRRFQRAGLLVVVDIHNEDRASELNPDWQDAFVKFWSALAGRFKDFDPDMTILEIINEPVFRGREADWNPFNARLADAIRKNAPQHTIMTSGADWGGIDGLKKLALLSDPNVIYSFHCYEPFPFTHQGATWSSEEVKPLRGVPYPSSPEAVQPLLPALENHPASRGMVEQYGEQRWNKQKLAARFDEAISWGKKNNVPLYCGEFGVFPPFAKPEHRANWFRDFGDILADQRIGWAVWGWDEGFGLNRRKRDGKLSVDEVVASSLGLKSV